MSDITIGTIVKVNPLSEYKRYKVFVPIIKFEGEREVTRISSQAVQHPYRIGMHGYHRDELLVKGVDYT